MDNTSKITNELVLVSSAASIALSVYLYAKGKREAGIFVGLWAPTILGMGAFLKSDNASPGTITTGDSIGKML